MKIGWFVIPLLLAGAASSRATPPAEEDARVALLAQLEKSVVVIRASSGRPFDETLGSGVIASSDGLVVTAAHVVDTAKSLQLTLLNGMSVEGTVLYLDNTHDIALIRMADAPPIESVAVLGDSSALRKGATVYVIGNPRGLEVSIATGIVSGRHAPDQRSEMRRRAPTRNGSRRTRR